MYPSVGIVIGTIVVIASPLLWIAWWKLADLGEMAGGRAAHVTAPSRRHLPAA